MAFMPQMDGIVPEAVLELLKRWAPATAAETLGPAPAAAPAAGPSGIPAMMPPKDVPGMPAPITPNVGGMDINAIIAAAAGKAPPIGASPPTVPELGPTREIVPRMVPPAATAPPPPPAPAPAPRPAPAAPEGAGARDPSLLSGIGSFLSGLGRGGGAILPALGGGIQGVQGDNATFRALTDKGLSDDMARAAMSNPVMMATALSPKTQVINNRLVNSTTGAVIGDYSDTAAKGPDVHKFAMPGGEEVSGVWNASRKRFELPNGAPLPDAAMPTDVPPGVDPKAYKRELAVKFAEAKATAATTLPNALRASDEAIKLIDDIAAHPSLHAAVGPIDGHPMVPTVFPGTRDVEAKIGQLQSKTFMEAYNALRGAGAITENEGKAAIGSFNRLAEKRVDEPDYKAALADAKRELLQLRQLAIRKAGGDFSPLPSSMTAAAPGGAPPPGAAAPAAPAAITEGATATNPTTGERLIYRGGKWGPM